MRLIAYFYVNNNNGNFLKNYRKIFLSLFKKIFESQGTYDNLYRIKKTKPFTFSVYIGKNLDSSEKEIREDTPLSFIFSTGDYSVFTHFYNGIIQLKEEVEIGKTRLKFSRIRPLPVKRIESSKVLFKTVGVSVLTNPSESAKDFKRWYILPTDDIKKFNEVLIKRTNTRFEHITGKKANFNLSFKMPTFEEFKILQKTYLVSKSFDKPIKETIVPHYGGYIRGFRGVFWLEGDPEILKFIREILTRGI